jgi:hypothetical protein
MWPPYDVTRRDVAWKRALTPAGVGARVPARMSLLCLRAVDVSAYTSHSLRRGGASFLARHHVKEDLIKLLGRWDSDVYR